MNPPEMCKVCGENPVDRGSGGMYKHDPYDRKPLNLYGESVVVH